jgi:hypothetical protein
LGNIGESVMKTLVAVSLLMIVAISTSAFAAGISCEQAAVKRAVEKFKIESQWTDEDVEKLASFAEDHEVYREAGDAENILTVEVISNDVVEWDGYATFKVMVIQKSDYCVAVKAKLVASEGL